ncbi:Predicted DNA-binding transcriptional regulator YafY, contains an HTH and WYL domains [Jatrophihabitans endophyticus]|uniref:Predicted DNA-binding transcriptional regulator YafY, contains an HTH and WYL domains n=1 Tax=Jatrophihabitans endophyticus TaxID=1206085 RepID=A0A1M5RWD9_9ACTN|nr:WYL domain-containing protein [Jatrophihabitans endophyticus]SHH30113.1 Predicted DNA-binding transcriptional regulator YafY, contains an HTH and WYL domains [Jatrophihabitans endophyticus]
MNRTERLYALVEELRAVAPRRRSATWLARRFEVSVRTVERDLDALRESGVPIYSDTGRTGGYALDRERTLPPLTLSADEALAISVALRTAQATPFARTARLAAQKVLAVLPADVRRGEQLLAQRVHRLADSRPAGESPRPADPVIERALATNGVVHLVYADAGGVTSERDVEPLGLLWADTGWYLLGWCRLRAGIRGFRLDRIEAASSTGEHVPARDAELRAELDRLDAEPLDG